MSETVTVSQWQDALREAAKRREVKPPGDGWLKLEGVARVLGLQRTSCFSAIKLLRADGQLEEFNGTAIYSNGRYQPCKYYRLKAKTTQTTKKE